MFLAVYWVEVVDINAVGKGEKATMNLRFMVNRFLLEGLTNKKREKGFVVVSA